MTFRPPLHNRHIHLRHQTGSFGFRVCTRTDEDALVAWLATGVWPTDHRTDHLLGALSGRCRTLRIEPPGRTDRIVGAARASFGRTFCARRVERLEPHRVEMLERLVDEATETGLLAELKTGPGQLGLETLLREITKLNMVRALNIPSACSSTCPHELLRHGGNGQHGPTGPKFSHHNQTTRSARRPTQSSMNVLCGIWFVRPRAEERVFNDRVRAVLRSSYSSYYRRMLPALLSALTFRSNNTAYRPVLDAIEL